MRFSRDWLRVMKIRALPDIDHDLMILRAVLLDACPEDHPEIISQIDKLLDERLKLMLIE